MTADDVVPPLTDEQRDVILAAFAGLRPTSYSSAQDDLGAHLTSGEST